MPFALKEKGFEQREIGVLADVHILPGKMRSNRGVGFSHLALPADPAVQFFYLIKLQSQRSS